MKKFILFILIIFIFPLRVNASSIVMDADTKRVLVNNAGDEKKLIASTTKILTAMVVINNVDIKKTVTIDENVLKSFGSGIYVEIGEKVSVEDLLYGLMLRSGNDAAIALACYVGGSIEGFSMLMNDLAKSIGMNNSNFINPSGLENDDGVGNISTAYDMGLLMSYAMKNDIFKTITSTKHRVVKTNYKTYDWYNKNKLLSMYKYTTGGKTGYTKKAYRTLVTSASKDNKNLVVVTLDESDDFNKHKYLYEDTFKKYKLVKVVDSKTFLKNEGLKVDKDINMLLKDSEINKVEVDVVYTDDVTDRVGYVNVSLNDKVYFKEDIYLMTEKDKKNSIFSKIKDKIMSIFNVRD